MYLRSANGIQLPCCYHAAGRPQQGGMSHGAPRKCPIAQASTSTAESTTPIKERPDWTGQSNLSYIINAITRVPLVKFAAKSLFKDSMRKQGVDWDAFVRTSELARQQLQALRQQLENPAIEYPPYYLKDFHSYETGNLNWLAASEVEPATLATAWRAYKDPELDPYQANDKMRGAIVDIIKMYQHAHQCRPVEDIIDVGCSIGMSTAPLARAWPHATVHGLDLSPYFLATAVYRQQQGKEEQQRVHFVHGLAEAAPFEDGSFDLVTIQFVVHECTAAAIRDIMAEAHRLLRKGGALAVVDINPRSPVIQSLPPLIFTLMKSTEPNMDEYVSVDMREVLNAAGFASVDTAEVDARHGAILGRK